MIRHLTLLYRFFSDNRREVLAEDHVHLDNCNIIGNVKVGFRSYANESLLRNVTIGRFCSIGRRCSIGAAKHDLTALTTHPIGASVGFISDISTNIGSDVWIGDNVIILAGVTIGHGAVVAAGSVVNKDVAPYSIVGGVPSRVIRSRFSGEEVDILIKSEWWRFGDLCISKGKEMKIGNIFEYISEHIQKEVKPHHVMRKF